MGRKVADYPNLMKEWNYAKNVGVSPSEVSYGSNIKPWWVCDKGHEWLASVKNRVNFDHGCPYCCNKKVCIDNCLETVRPDIAAEWHSKNVLSPREVTPGSRKKVWWLGLCGHEWESVIHTRTNGVGCPYCKNNKVCIDNCLATVNKELSLEWNYEKNYPLTPYDILFGSNIKRWWICKKGHSWCVSPSSRMEKKTGCPVCCASKGEKKIKEFLDLKSRNYIQQYSVKKLGRFDFFVPEKLIIEYHGDHHYYPVNFGSGKTVESLIKRIEKDKNKERWCKDNKINLFVIPYWDFKNINEILDCKLSGKEPVFSESPEIVKKYANIRDFIMKTP